MTSARHTTMKALRLIKEGGSVPLLSLTTVPKPELIPNHVLVKVHASAIHPSDIMNARGGLPLTTFPRTPGRDFSGVIVEGPPSRIGEEVYGTSGFTHAFTVDGFQAEYCLAHEDAVAPKPKSLSFVQAACIGVPFTTASLALRRANTVPSDTVLVIGASGAVGSAVVRLAQAKGCQVFKASRSDNDDINTSKDPELDRVAVLTQNRGIDVIIDTVGQPSLMKAAVGKLVQGGRLAFIAAPRTGAADVVLDMTNFYREEKSLVGCNSLKYSVEVLAEQMKAMSAEFDNGQLKADEGQWTTVSLEKATEAYENVMNKRGNEKYVVVME